MSARIDVNQHEIADFCETHHVRRLAFFGSVLRDDFSAASDVDVLVEFEEGHVPGLLGMARLERKLSEVLGRQADLRTAEDLSRYFREQVLADAEEQYAA